MNHGDTTRLDGGRPNDGPDPGPLDGTAVARLLALGRERDLRPVAGLVDRLGHTDGATWFAQSVLDAIVAPWGRPDELAAGASTPLERLRDLKDRGHALIERSDTFEDRLAGVAAYFLAVAAALVQHGERITRRDRARLDPMLLDLAAAMPEPWSGLLSQAAVAEETSSG